MKQLRRLSEVVLQKSTKVKQPNGTLLQSYADVGTYKVIEQEITDKVFSSIYGANISKMLRLSSPHETLEKFLKSKANDGADNISLYYILIGLKRYRIVSAYNNWVDIEFYETFREVPTGPEEIISA